jgi:hypothetical protein
VFQVTGYAPALPLVLREKGMAWRFGDVETGYLSAARRAPRTPFVRRVGGAILEQVGATLEAADRALAQLWTSRGEAIVKRSDEAAYADAMMNAIDAARRAARGVVVVLSPSETVQQKVNRRALDARLAVHGGAPWLRVVDLDHDPQLASDRTLRIDDWNYASTGIALIANRIAPALLNLIPQS